MKLFLAAEIKNPVAIEKLRQFVGGFESKKILYIPTAANGEAMGLWKAGGSYAMAQSLNASLTVLELETTTEEQLIEELKDIDILWIAGGMSAYLLYWIRRRKLDVLLPELLSRGVIYVGSSAGSMVCSRTLSVAEWFFGAPETGASLIPGLGLIDFAIYPHFEDALFSQIEKKWEKGSLYLLKNDEVITVVDGSVTVLGETRIVTK